MNTKKKNKLKFWLSENKIYFETVTSLLLALMAILLSLLTYITTVRQIENEELLNQPIFKIYSEQFSYFNSATIKSNYSENNSEWLKIEKTGTKVNKFKSEVYTFLKVETNNSDSNKYKGRITIYKRINDYYGGAFPMNNGVGNLISYLNLGNLHKIYSESLEFRKKYDDKFPSTFISNEKFIMLTFQDFKNKQHKLYYKVDNIYNEQADSKIVEDLIKEHDIFNSVSINSITPEYIKGLILDDRNKQNLHFR